MSRSKLLQTINSPTATTSTYLASVEPPHFPGDYGQVRQGK